MEFLDLKNKPLYVPCKQNSYKLSIHQHMQKCNQILDKHNKYVCEDENVIYFTLLIPS